MTTGWLSRQGGWSLCLGGRRAWTGCQARHLLCRAVLAGQPGLRVALLVSRGEQQLPVHKCEQLEVPCWWVQGELCMLALPGRGRGNSPSVPTPDAWQTGALG